MNNYLSSKFLLVSLLTEVIVKKNAVEVPTNTVT